MYKDHDCEESGRCTPHLKICFLFTLIMTYEVEVDDAIAVAGFIFLFLAGRIVYHG